MNTSNWAAYLDRISHSEVQDIVAARTGVAQPTISRWLRGASRPTAAGTLARVAVAYDRNPLEAFVAAGVLPLELAEDVLDADSLALLAEIGIAGPRPAAPSSDTKAAGA